ncbi:hypothetical protein DFH08DRAFT_819063 [Mycena albidolilacea]|uniref:Uncharacterized protein n=1 Tax=Mycena albidolilacea TaxID=1033008 RepID=A0AAD6ZF84_9AGAR|nr:hypothetical protein DFH08DRAFT_819063 [Mycena albidolilacea]
MNVMSTLPWTQLTSLTLTRIYMHECLPVLAQTSNLVHCELELYDFGGTSPSEGFEVTLPSLESLTLLKGEGQTGVGPTYLETSSSLRSAVSESPKACWDHTQLMYWLRLQRDRAAAWRMCISWTESRIGTRGLILRVIFFGSDASLRLIQMQVIERTSPQHWRGTIISARRTKFRNKSRCRSPPVTVLSKIKHKSSVSKVTV